MFRGKWLTSNNTLKEAITSQLLLKKVTGDHTAVDSLKHWEARWSHFVLRKTVMGKQTWIYAGADAATPFLCDGVRQTEGWEQRGNTKEAEMKKETAARV